MATVYKFNVRCVSAFSSYSAEDVAKIIKEALEALKKLASPQGLGLESIEIGAKTPILFQGEYRLRRRLFGGLVLQRKKWHQSKFKDMNLSDFLDMEV